MEALLYEKGPDRLVTCLLCAHRCVIHPGKRGICRVRENRDGVLHTLVYGKLIARHVDPIEKKPLFHLLPGSLSCSIATVGCNFTCKFCQNADIAQLPRDRSGLILGQDTSADAVVMDALKTGCASISYTYTEPTVFFEFACDTARKAHEKGLKNIFVSNGYMSPEAIERIVPCLDGANIDLKAYTEEFYKAYCGAHLEPVKESLRLLTAAGVLVEITTLIIPGLNDHPDELSRLSEFIVGDLGPDTPWHISRFHPTYRLTDRPPTPLATLKAARDIGRRSGLHYVYMGNVPGQGGEDTFCPGCGSALIRRMGFQVLENRIPAPVCPDCGLVLKGFMLA